jgi:CDP-diacylglycerol--serine O-phosphatidyltransferase
MIKKHIPNFITSLNLFTGCVAVWFAFNGNYESAFLAILVAAVFDFFDGFAARMLKAYSPMGKELDSLADVISFGVAPGVIVFSMLSDSGINEWLPFFAFLIPVFSGLRLAKFNIDERQSTSFIGLPTPANAIFLGGLAFSYSDLLITNVWVLIVITLLFSYLLVAEIPMFALKFKNASWNDNKIQYFFLIVCFILLGLFQQNAFAPIIGWYILLSVINAIYLAFVNRKSKI